jgi:DNA invertase Pin-like site-specific DNA recombinase
MNHESTNYQTSDTLASCVTLINRNYPRLMKIGGPLLGAAIPYVPPPPSKMKQAMAIRLKKIIDLQSEGYRVPEIAENLGIHFNTVYKALKRNRKKGKI